MKIKIGVSLPAYQRGYKIVDDKGFIIAAMSIGNGYFGKEKIEELIPFWSKSFSKVKILIADSISIHTYKAKGYSEKEARQKTRLAGNRLKNHCQRAIQQLRSRGDENNVEFVEWSDEVEHNTEYEKQLSIVHGLYEKSLEFKKDAKEATLSVLKSKVEEDINLEKAAEEGVNYLLEELAFLLASPKIFNEKNISYIYHREWPIFVNLVDGKYDKKVRSNVAFIQTDD